MSDDDLQPKPVDDEGSDAEEEDDNDEPPPSPPKKVAVAEVVPPVPVVVPVLPPKPKAVRHRRDQGRSALSLMERSQLDLRRARLRRLIQKAGLPQMQAASERALRQVYLAVLADLVHGATQLSRYTYRRTITARDVRYALHLKFHTQLYSFRT